MEPVEDAQHAKVLVEVLVMIVCRRAGEQHRHKRGTWMTPFPAEQSCDDETAQQAHRGSLEKAQMANGTRCLERRGSVSRFPFQTATFYNPDFKNPISHAIEHRIQSAIKHSLCSPEFTQVMLQKIALFDATSEPITCAS